MFIVAFNTVQKQKNIVYYRYLQPIGALYQGRLHANLIKCRVSNSYHIVSGVKTTFIQ